LYPSSKIFTRKWLALNLSQRSNAAAKRLG
jgi:hypothetical protein